MIKTENQITTQQGIKDLHLKQIYLLCLHGGRLSRAQLKREMGLSFPSVSALVDELIERGVLEETGTAYGSQRGRPSVQLQVKSGSFAIPVVAMTQSGYRCRLFDITTDALEYTFVPYGFNDDAVARRNGLRCPDFDSLAGPLVQWIGDMKKRYNLLDMVMTTPGSVDADGVLASSSALLSTPAHFIESIEEATGLKVYRGNISDHYTYAEYHYNRNVKDFALILIHNGVGAAVIRDGLLFETKPYRAGEFGHISIDYKGKPCLCGGVGCLERYISTTALAEDSGMDYPTLCKRYLEGDPKIAEFMQSRAELLVAGISNMLTMQPVQQIVLGGEIREMGEPFLNLIRQCIERIGFRRLMRGLEVRYAISAEGAEMSGALWNFIENQMSMVDFVN